MILNPKSVPGLKIGDIIEIFQPEGGATSNATASGGSNSGGSGGDNKQGDKQSSGSLASGRLISTLHVPSTPAKHHHHHPVSSAGGALPNNTLDPNNALVFKIQSLEPVKGKHKERKTEETHTRNQLTWSHLFIVYYYLLLIFSFFFS